MSKVIVTIMCRKLSMIRVFSVILPMEISIALAFSV